jgi:hypothetical protein
MPASPIAAADAAPVFTINSFDREGPQATIQLLADAGLFASDDARGAVLLAKRINHALYSDFSKEGLPAERLATIRAVQEKFRPLVAGKDPQALAKDGTLAELLDSYMSFLVSRSSDRLARLTEGKLAGQDEHNAAVLSQLIARERRKLKNLVGEQATYRNGGDYLAQQAASIAPCLKEQRYLPLGRLVAASGLVKDAASPEAAADMVSDVVGLSVARSVLQLREAFRPLAALDASASEEDRATRMQLIALELRQGTQPLAAQFAFEPEGTELDRLVALKTLLSAQLNAAFTQEGLTPPQAIALEKEARRVTDSYAQAALSLSYHYLAEGAGKDDARIGQLQQNLKKTMDASGIVLLSKNDALVRAAKLAQASANDLLLAAGNNEPQAAQVRVLAKAAGVPVERVPLAPESQLVAVRLSDPADFHHLIDASFAQRVASRGAELVRRAGVAVGMALALAFLPADGQAAPVREQLFARDSAQARAHFGEPQRKACMAALTARYGNAYRPLRAPAFDEGVSQVVYDTLFWTAGDRALARGVAFSAPLEPNGGGAPATLLCYFALQPRGLALQNSFVLPAPLQLAGR